MKKINVEIRPDGFGLVSVEYIDYVSDALVANADHIREALRVASVPLCTNGAILDIKTGHLLVHESILALIGCIYLVYPNKPTKLRLTLEVEIEFTVDL